MLNLEKKALKNISVIAAFLFLLNNISDGSHVNKDSLKTPVGDANTRMLRVEKLRPMMAFSTSRPNQKKRQLSPNRELELLHEKLERAIKEKGYSSGKLAEEIGVNTSHLYRLRIGQRGSTPETMKKLWIRVSIILNEELPEQLAVDYIFSELNKAVSAGYKITQISEDTNIDQAMLCRFKNGDRGLGIDNQEALFNYLAGLKQGHIEGMTAKMMSMMKEVRRNKFSTRDLCSIIGLTDADIEAAFTCSDWISLRVRQDIPFAIKILKRRRDVCQTFLQIASPLFDRGMNLTTLSTEIGSSPEELESAFKGGFSTRRRTDELFRRLEALSDEPEGGRRRKIRVRASGKISTSEYATLSNIMKDAHRDGLTDNKLSDIIKQLTNVTIDPSHLWRIRNSERRPSMTTAGYILSAIRQFYEQKAQPLPMSENPVWTSL